MIIEVGTPANVRWHASVQEKVWDVVDDIPWFRIKRIMVIRLVSIGNSIFHAH